MCAAQETWLSPPISGTISTLKSTSTPCFLWLRHPPSAKVGYPVLTVTERSEGQLSLEDARPEILQQLSIEMQRDVLKQERAKAKIERP